jgi:hypothetical protein
MKWKNRIVGSGEEPPDQLLANVSNWRRHPASQRKALRGALGTVGWIQAVLVNKRTGFVIDGHARIEEAISNHEPTVPVLYVDLSPEEERIALASLDPIGAMADRDQEALNELLDGLQVDDENLQSLLDSLSTVVVEKPDPPAGEGPTDEVTCPACGHTFNIGVRVKPSAGSPRGDEMPGGN